MWTGSRIGTVFAIGGLGVALLAVGSGPAAASNNGQITFLAGVPVGQVRQIAASVNPPPVSEDPTKPAPTPPTLSGLLDIYNGTNLIANDVRAGTLVTVRVPTGNRTINVYADGQVPGTSRALLTKSGVQVNATVVQTMAIGLNRGGGALRAEVFRNQFPVAPGAGNAWVVFRNIGAMAAVDVRLGGQVAFRGLQNSQQAINAWIPGAAAIRVLGGSGRNTTLVRNDNYSVRGGRVNIVYVWGSENAGNVRLTTQLADIG
jgi:hypothetical protein